MAGSSWEEIFGGLEEIAENAYDGFSDNKAMRSKSLSYNSKRNEKKNDMIPFEVLVKHMLDSRKELEKSIELSISVDDNNFKSMSVSEMFNTFIQEIEQAQINYMRKVDMDNKEYTDQLIDIIKCRESTIERLKREVEFLKKLPTGEKTEYKDEIKKGWKSAYKYSVKPSDVLEYYYEHSKNISETAKYFNVSRNTVYTRLKEAGWKPDKKHA